MARTKTVSFSELDAYRQCRLKHHLAWKERWREPVTPAALSRGTLVHSVLEEHYTALKEGGGLPEARKRIRDAELLYDPRSGNQTEEQELVEWMYDGYVEAHGTDEDWEILAVEHRDEAWLLTERGTRSSFKLKVKIDLVVRDRSAGGGIYVVDHKSCRNLPKGKDVDLDDQQGLYTSALRTKGHDVRGSVTNSLRTQKLVRAMSMDERFKRESTVRTDVELDTIRLEALRLFREAYRPVKGQDLPPRSPDTERCGWRCGFTEPCLASRKGADARQMLEDMGFVQDWERH